MINPNTGVNQMAVARDRLVLNLIDRAGGIWLLDNPPLSDDRRASRR